MERTTTVAQLKAPECFSGAVDLAVLKTGNESKEIQAYMADPSFLGEISDIVADALHAQHRPDADPGGEGGTP